MDTLKQWNYPQFSPIPSLSGFFGILEHMSNSFMWTLCSPKDTMDHGKDAPIFVLIPGFSGNHATMRELGNNLWEKANVAYAPDFPLFNTTSIREAAKLLNEKIEKILSLHWKKIDIRLVWFSNGWLIALDALRHKSSLRVSEVITMWTPFRWTPLANIISFTSRACSEINEKWWYLRGSNLATQLGKLSVHVAHNDSIVPASHQIPDMSIAPGKITVIHHEWFHHTNFISGEKWKDIANMLLS